MDIRNIPSDIDLRLSLLYGDEMTGNFLRVKPLTIGQIKKMGYMEYSKHLSILTLDKKEIVGDDPEYDGISLVEIVIHAKNEVLTNAFSEAISAFTGEDIDNLLINDKYGFVFGGLTLDRNAEDCIIVNGDNFPDLVQIIKYQNCLSSTNETYSKPNPADEKSRRILEKLKKGKEIVEKAKQSASNDGGDSNIDFADIVSSVSTKSNTYNKHNVWDMTVYQLYDEYKRLEAISSYETNILAMVQGAKIENLKHWSAKID